MTRCVSRQERSPPVRYIRDELRDGFCDGRNLRLDDTDEPRASQPRITSVAAAQDRKVQRVPDVLTAERKLGPGWGMEPTPVSSGCQGERAFGDVPPIKLTHSQVRQRYISGAAESARL